MQKESLAAIVITLFFISVGIGKSSDKLGMRAIFLLIIVFSYYVILSIFRMSGGRRVQVVDWIWIIYFSIGLGQITLWAFRWLFSVEVPVWFTGQQKGRGGELPSNQKLISPENPSLRWKSIFSFCFLVLFCGALVPLIEQIIPPQYTEETLQTRIETIIMLDDSEIIREFLDNGGAVQQGKALYPRYYPAGEYGENQATDANLRQIGYLSTFLAGSNSPEIILPLTDIQQLGLPNYSDVLVVGCEEEYFDTLAIFSESQNLIIFRDPLPENLACPLENE